MSSLEQRIVESKLTKVQSRIAKKLLQNESHICFSTLANLSEMFECSDASLIRTARALGYSGFNDMQKQLREELSNTIKYASNSILTPVEKLVSNFDNYRGGDLAKELFESAIKNLELTFRSNSMAKIDAISDILIKSSRKYFVGLRGSGGIINNFSISIAHLLPNVVKLSAADFAILEAVQDITKKDCIFIVDFPRYPKLIDIVISIARKAEAKIILMTEGATSKHASSADILISASVDSISFFNSYIAPLFLAELISADVAKKLGKKSEGRMKALDECVSKSGMY